MTPRAAAIALLLAAWCTCAPAQPARTPVPVIERAQAGPCVGDPAFMRRNHMDLLRHQREETVRAGARSGAYRLQGCIGCHASAQTASVARGEGNFCVSCHSYAAVRIDCFECHAAQPRQQARAGAVR